MVQELSDRKACKGKDRLTPHFPDSTVIIFYHNYSLSMCLQTVYRGSLIFCKHNIAVLGSGRFILAVFELQLLFQSYSITILP